MFIYASQILTWEWAGALIGVGLCLGLLLGFWLGMNTTPAEANAAREIDPTHQDFEDLRLARKPTNNNENRRRERQDLAHK